MSRNPLQLSPFAHELDRYGEDCALDCPACRWVREQGVAEVPELSCFRSIVERYKDCEIFQIGLRELGLSA
jgi:hypothetical protein